MNSSWGQTKLPMQAQYSLVQATLSHGGKGLVMSHQDILRQNVQDMHCQILPTASWTAWNSMSHCRLLP